MNRDYWPFILLMPSEASERIRFLQALFSSPTNVEIIRLFDGAAELCQKDIMLRLGHHSNKTLILALKKLVDLNILEEHQRVVRSGSRTVRMKCYRLSEIGRWYRVFLEDVKTLDKNTLSAVFRELVSIFMGKVALLRDMLGASYTELVKTVVSSALESIVRRTLATPPDTVVFGSTALDIYLGEKPMVFSGGSGANVAVNCARLGLATSFATRVPGDLLGLGLVLELVDEGVDISLSRIDPDARTTVCIIKNWASEQPEYICGCSKESGGQPPVLTELSDDVVTLCSKARTIYLGEGVCRFYEELLGRIDTENKVVIYRPSFMSLELFWDECSKVLRHNPILLLNERKLGILQRKGVDFPGDLMGLGVDRIIVTKGSRGTTLYTQGKVVDIPAEHRAVVDTVGAGDVFSAALIYRLVKGDDIEAAARYATKLASQSISVLGPRKLAKP